jgi:hypothetical protein
MWKAFDGLGKQHEGIQNLEWGGRVILTWALEK